MIQTDHNLGVYSAARAPVQTIVFGGQRVWNGCLVDDLLLLLGIEHSLDLQRPGVDPGLLEQVAQLLVFLGQRIVRYRLRSDYLQCADAHHLLEFENHLLDLQRLRKKAAVVGLVGIGHRNLPDTRMTLYSAHGCASLSEFQPVHASGI